MYGSFDADGEGEEGDVSWLGGRGDKREVGYEWVMDSRVVIFSEANHQWKHASPPTESVMNIPMARSIMLTAGPSCKEMGTGGEEGEERLF